MELVTILLSGLLGLLSGAGVVVDRVAESTLRDRLYDAETLVVRVDNAPTYQLVQGRVDQVRIAGRGLYPLEGVRVAVLEVETDAIALNPQLLRDGTLALERPLNAGVRLVLREADVAAALRSPQVMDFLAQASRSLASLGSSDQTDGFQVINPRVEFLPHQRLRLQVTLRDRRSPDPIRVRLETGVQVIDGSQLNLINPRALVNGQAIPDELVQGLAQGISRRFNLRQYEEQGITARLLQLEITPDEMAIAAVISVAPMPPNPESETPAL